MEFTSTTFEKQPDGEMKLAAAIYEGVQLKGVDTIATLHVNRSDACVTLYSRSSYSGSSSIKLTPSLIDSLCEYLQQVKPLLAVHGITDKDTKEGTQCSS